MDETIKAFVYGTLRPPRAGIPADQCRFFPRIEPALFEHVPATLAGAALYDLGTYPAARPGESTIHGDLLTLAPEALPIMDRLEGHPHFFYREQVSVQTAAGETAAWIYWAPAGLVLSAVPLRSGDWFARETLAPEPALLTGKADPVLVQLVERFKESASVWLSTVRPLGQAHSTPIWHVWLRGRIYMVTTAGAVKVANIQNNPSVAVTHPDPVQPIIIEGWATVAPTTREAIQPLFQDKYDWDIDSSPAYDTVLQITPLKLMAWGDQGEGRWDAADLLQLG